MNKITTQFLQAVEAGNYEEVKSLLENANIVNEQPSQTKGFINSIVGLVASSRENKEYKERAQDNKPTIYINVRSPEDKMTALMIASTKGYLDIMKLLLDYGVDTEIKDKDNKPILILLILNNSVKAQSSIELLLNHPTNTPDINATDNEAQTPLHIIFSTPNIYFFRNMGLFIKKGANLNLQDQKGKTPLHDILLNSVSIQNKIDEINDYLKNNNQRIGRFSIIKFLIEKGARLDIKDIENISPLNDMFFDISWRSNSKRELLHMPASKIFTGFHAKCSNSFFEFNNIESKSGNALKTIVLKKIANQAGLTSDDTIGLELWYQLGCPGIDAKREWKQQKKFCALFNIPFFRMEKSSSLFNIFTSGSPDIKKDLDLTKTIFLFHNLLPNEIKSLICAYLFTTFIKSVPLKDLQNSFTHLIEIVNFQPHHIEQPMQRDEKEKLYKLARADNLAYNCRDFASYARKAI